MTLDKLTSLQSKPDSTSPDVRRRRPPVILLPVGLLLAFLVIFALMFGERLVPARSVAVAPVIALRTAIPASAAGESAPPTTPVPTAGPRQLLFQASGWVEPDPYTVDVPTLVNGVVNEVRVLEGEAVKKGQLLATLIEDDAKLDVEAAERKIRTLDAMQVAHCAELPVLNSEMHAIQKRIAAEQALLAELQDTATRFSAVPKGSVPELEVRKAQLQVERQQAALEEAQAELPRILSKINKVDLQRLTNENLIKEAQTDLNRKKLALERTRITSPMDGIVLRLHVAPGKKRMLEADDPRSAVVVELYDPSKLQARIDVPLTEAAALRVGQPVRLTSDLLPDVEFDGEVSRIVGQADLQRNTLQAKVRILNPDPRLRPEMLVRAEFFPAPAGEGPSTTSRPAPESGRLALYAPASALFDRTGSTARVWIVSNQRTELRDLSLGADERDDHVLVREGLRPGDRVILPPHDGLEPDQRVKVTATR